MKKTLLITGSTDGIGREAAKLLLAEGHRVLLHGRNPDKLQAVVKELAEASGGELPESYVADLSRMADVEALAKAVSERHQRLDVLINNAGVFNTSRPLTDDGLDVRFVVNTIAPYLLVQRLLALMDASGRIVNLSSAAQAPVELEAFHGRMRLSNGAAYAQSKLAITAWSRHMAQSLGEAGPLIVAVNPGSMLGTKMVKQAFGVSGGDVQIGAQILVRAALSDEFAGRSGQYFDNDARRFAAPHPAASDPAKIAQIVGAVESVLAKLTSSTAAG